MRILFSMIVAVLTVIAVQSANAGRHDSSWPAMDDSVTAEKIFFSNTPPSGNNEIYMMSPDGSGLQRLTNHAGRDCGPKLSPNKQKIAFYVHAPGNEYSWSEYIMNVDGSNITRLTDMANVTDGSPAWSPDGTRIVFGRGYPQEGFRAEVWVMNADGSNQHRVGDFDGDGPDWSPDGARLLFSSKVGDNYHICAADTDGSNFQQITTAGTENWWPSYSPDGTRIAFQTNRDGNHEIYVMNVDGTNPVRLTNHSSEDANPCWSPDGTRIAFLSFRDGRYNIYSMNADDGSDQTRLTTMQTHNIQPDWKQLRIPLKKYLGQTPPDTIPRRFPPSYLLSDGTWWWHGSPAFSPDGTEMFFVKYISTTDKMEMYQMNVVNGEWSSPQRPSFASDSSDNSPVFTPDGNRLLFTSFRDGSIKIYQVTRTDTGWSEPELVNMDYQSLPGNLGLDISLTSDETIYFDIYWPGIGIDIYRSHLVNGQYSQFERLPDEVNSAPNDATPYVDPNEEYLIFMSNRPGGTGLHDLYISFRNSDDTWTQAQNMGESINGSNEDSFPLVSPDGQYLFFNSARSGDRGYNAYWVNASVIESLRPTPLDTTQKIVFYSEAGGDAEICLMNTDGSGLKQLTSNAAQDQCPVLSPDGQHIAFCSDRNGNWELYLMNNDGSNITRLTNTPQKESQPEWSPDGEDIVFTRWSPSSWDDGDIFIINTDGGNERQLTSDPANDSRPQWFPDGSRIIFNSKRDGNYEIYTMKADGTDQQRLTNTPGNELFPDLSPDMQRIAYALVDFQTFHAEIHVMNADGTGDSLLAQGGTWTENAQWSPDGSKILFQTDRTGNFEIFVMNADGSNPQNLTKSSADDYWPSWGVIQPAPVQILEETLAPGTQGCPYVDTLETVPGTGTSPFEWVVTSGSLPAGLTLNESSGVISGHPSEAGTFDFSVEVTDARQTTDTGSFTLIVDAHDDEKADANADCTINVLDVLTVVNIILDLRVPDEDEIWRSDCNGTDTCDGDGTINVLDALKIINIILGTAQCP